MPIVCGIGGSYKRLLDVTIRGEHSVAFSDLPEIVKTMKGGSACRIALHYSPQPDGYFYDGCMRYLDLINKTATIDYLQITAKWPDMEELGKIKKHMPDMDVVLQVPLYKMQNMELETIGRRIKNYSGIVAATALDASGGQGQQHKCAYSGQLIDLLQRKQVTMRYVLAGGIDSRNAETYILELYKRGYTCAIDAQSKLRTGLQLDGEKVYQYLYAAYRAYHTILPTYSKEMT